METFQYRIPVDSPFPPAGFDVPARAVGNKLAAELSLDINLSDHQDCYMCSKGFLYNIN